MYPSFRNGGYLARVEELQLEALFNRLKQALPGLFGNGDDLPAMVSSTYGQSSRFFHGNNHLLEMAGQETPYFKQAFAGLKDAITQAHGSGITAEEEKFLKAVHLVAALGHDTEYHIDGQISQFAEANGVQEYIDLHADNSASIKRDWVQADAPVKMALDMFGEGEGGKFTPQTGRNELISAVSTSRFLQKRNFTLEGVEDFDKQEFSLAVAACIEASRPFRTPEQYQEAMNRVAATLKEYFKTKPNYNDDVTNRRVNLIMGVATIMANQDVFAFLGNRIPPAKPNVVSVQETFRGGELLVTEEANKALQQAVTPGDYAAYDLLAPSFKRVRLYEKVLPHGKNNIFHGFKLQGDHDIHFPPVQQVLEWNNAARAEDSLSGNADIANIAHKARVAALVLVHAIALAHENDKKYALKIDHNTKLADLLAGMPERRIRGIILGELREAEGESPVPSVNAVEADRHTRTDAESKAVRIAVKVLSDRRHGLPNDITNSPIARAILEKVGISGVDSLYQAAEKHFFTDAGDKAKAEAFLETCKQVLGKERVEELQASIPASMRSRLAVNALAKQGYISKDIQQEGV